VIETIYIDQQCGKAPQTVEINQNCAIAGVEENSEIEALAGLKALPLL
jgi:hypothetical protein